MKKLPILLLLAISLFATTTRVNCGGALFVDSGGTTWLADTYYSGGTAATASTAIDDTSEDTLYQSARTGTSFSYSFPVTRGVYTVRLLFAEIQGKAVDQRIFNVVVNGGITLSNLDVRRRVGALNTAYERTITVVAIENTLTVVLSGVAGEALVNAIELYPVSDLEYAPWSVGTTLPSTCLVGDYFFKSDEAAGSNLFGCTSTNTWTLLGGAGGSASFNAIISGTNKSAAMVVDSGASINPTGTGVVNANQINGVDFITLAEGVLANSNSGTPRVATSADLSSPLSCLDAGSSDTYACNLSPNPGSYTVGALYRFKANTANTTGATINFNTIGPRDIIKENGGALATNDIRAGQWVDLVYDGSNMQMHSLLGNAPATTADAVTGASGLSVGGRVTTVDSAGSIKEEDGVTVAAGVLSVPAGFVGPVTGTSTGILNKTFLGTATQVPQFSGTPAGSLCVETDGDGNLVEAAAACGSGGGASAASDLTDFKITITTTTATNDTFNVATGHARIGNYSPTHIDLGKYIVTGGSGDIKVFIDSNNNLVCHKQTSGSITGTQSGALACSNVATPAYPVGSIPLYDLAVSGAQAVSIDADDRAFLSARGIVAGSGIEVTESGGVATIGIDSATIPTLGAGSNDFTGAVGALEIKLLTGSEGTCDASSAGRVVFILGAGSTASTLKACGKNASDVYAWTALTTWP